MKYKYLHKIQQVRKKYSNVRIRERERYIHYTLTWLIIAMYHDTILNKNKLNMPVYFILPIRTSFFSYKYCLRKYNKNGIGKQLGLINAHAHWRM